MSDLHLHTLSPDEARQIDHTCDRFEAAWKAGQRPDLREYLGSADQPARSALLRQLLLLDWDYRRRAGEPPSVSDYHARFPGERTLVEEVQREMTQAGESTQSGLEESQARHTPWLGAGSADRTDKAPIGSDRYELLQEVGHGGIGVVFRGRDRHLGRELAVKVLREAYWDKTGARERFLDEARVGSQLQHPAIVPVYEQGWFDERRPYFTMKLVQGQTLAALLRERPNPSHDLPRFLAVLEQVCQAMAYAHARGVVHRDLKPANIMVGAFGEVQVMDWGFAKVLPTDGPSPAETPEQDCATPPVYLRREVSQSGALMGTPAYMPPEQARGETTLIDPRTDVFALGAILCEILTGQPPYGGASIEEVCARAAQGDLADACARLDGCGADEALRQLARRCLAAPRGDRPPDAEVVARDLTAYLASVQERLHQAQLERAAAQARAQEAAAKARAERRARQLTLALAAALLLGGAIAVWQAWVANQAKRDALAAAAAEKEAKEEAQTKAAQIRAVFDFVQDQILAAARPKGQAGGLGQDVTLRKAIEAALPAVDKSFADQPLIEAPLRITLGNSFLYLGQIKTAAEQYERARALYTEHLGPEHRKTLESMNNLANSYDAVDRSPEALQLRQRVLELRQASLGPDDPDTLMSMNNLANSYSRQGRFDKALQLHKKTLELRQARLGPDNEYTLWSMFNVAGCYASLGQLDKALELFEQTMQRRSATLGRDHPDTLDCINNVALVYQMLGQNEKALKLHQETLAVRKARLDPDHPLVLDSMSSVANVYDALGHHEKALPLRQQTLALYQAKLGPNHRDTLLSKYHLACCYTDLHRDAEALELHEKTLAVRQARLGPKHPDTIASVWAVAGLRIRKFATAKDVAGCRATVAMCEKLQPADPDGLYSLACYRAITAAVLRASKKSPDAARQADAEADRAMSCLKQAIAAGYKDIAQMKQDKDLDALRDRPDFQKLLAQRKAGG